MRINCARIIVFDGTLFFFLLLKAMGPWGLVIYNENKLLYNESLHSVARKRRVAITISHEFSHQWFANLGEHEI